MKVYKGTEHPHARSNRRRSRLPAFAANSPLIILWQQRLNILAPAAARPPWRASARSGSGKFMVNGRTMENYFVVDSQRLLVMQPLVATETGTEYDIRVNVQGGGPMGRAARFATASRALCWKSMWPFVRP